MWGRGLAASLVTLVACTSTPDVAPGFDPRPAPDTVFVDSLGSRSEILSVARRHMRVQDEAALVAVYDRTMRLAAAYFEQMGLPGRGEVRFSTDRVAMLKTWLPEDAPVDSLQNMFSRFLRGWPAAFMVYDKDPIPVRINTLYEQRSPELLALHEEFHIRQKPLEDVLVREGATLAEARALLEPVAHYVSLYLEQRLFRAETTEELRARLANESILWESGEPVIEELYLGPARRLARDYLHLPFTQAITAHLRTELQTSRKNQ